MEIKHSIGETHLHPSYGPFNGIYPYIDMEDGEFIIVPNGTREEMFQKMKERGIDFVIEPAIDVDSNELLLKLSKEYPGYLFPAVGNHPTRCIKSPFRDFKRVKEYAFNNADDIVAIGELGLDYHYERSEQHRLKQKIWFQYQINLADKLNLPLILHIRMANEDAIRILRRNRKKLHGGVCHCFNSGPDVARAYIELGLCLGVGGTLLGKGEYSDALRDTVKEVDIRYILTETDGPYVRPSRPENKGISKKKWRKARNTSLILPAIIDKIAEIKGMDPYDVARITTDNAKRVFPKINANK